MNAFLLNSYPDGMARYVILTDQDYDSVDANVAGALRHVSSDRGNLTNTGRLICLYTLVKRLQELDYTVIAVGQPSLGGLEQVFSVACEIGTPPVEAWSHR